MNLFKSQRLAVGLSRKDAAEKLNISLYHLRNIENNQRAPRQQLLLEMSELYQCNLKDLVKESVKILSNPYSKRVV